MPLTLPTASDAVEEARKIAERLVDDFRKYPDPHDPAPEAAREKFVLTSFAVYYYERSSVTKFDHTVGVALPDSEDSMPYMNFPEAVLQQLKNSRFGGQGSDVWRKGTEEWAFSWDEERDD